MSGQPDRPAMLSDLRTLQLEMRGAIAASAEDTGPYFDVVAEKMRDDFKVVINTTVALDEKVDKLIARNAVEHAAFVEAIGDHDVRRRVLEKIHDLSKPL